MRRNFFQSETNFVGCASIYVSKYIGIKDTEYLFSKINIIVADNLI